MNKNLFFDMKKLDSNSVSFSVTSRNIRWEEVRTAITVLSSAFFQMFFGLKEVEEVLKESDSLIKKLRGLDVVGLSIKVDSLFRNDVMELAMDEDVSRMQKVTMTSLERSKINKEISRIIDKKYFSNIPLDEIFDACKKVGYVPLQEDYTEWSGFLVGPEGMEHFMLGDISQPVDQKWGIQYVPVKNSVLWLSWRKMEFGKYEIISYVS